MIHEVDELIEAWVGEVVDAKISFGCPDEPPDEPGVQIYLLGVALRPPLRERPLPPLELSLRYLITTWPNSAKDAHRQLGELAFAAMEHDAFEVELEPLTAAEWSALHCIPRPALVVRAPAKRERPAPHAKLVRHPIVVEQSPAVTVSGRVVGPGDVPLSGARVEIPALGLATRSDSHGGFAFRTVPAEPRTRRFRVNAKGRQVVLDTDLGITPDQPLVVRFDFGGER